VPCVFVCASSCPQRMRSTVVDRLTPPSEVDKAKAALKAASNAEPASPPHRFWGPLRGSDGGDNYIHRLQLYHRSG